NPVHVGHVGRAVVLGLDPPRQEDARDGPVPVTAVRRALLLAVAFPEVRDGLGGLPLDELTEGFGEGRLGFTHHLQQQLTPFTGTAARGSPTRSGPRTAPTTGRRRWRGRSGGRGRRRWGARCDR